MLDKDGNVIGMKKFDKDGKLVLTRRAKEKMLWPSDWDGTFASHPRESETYVSSGERRMFKNVSQWYGFQGH